MKSLGSRVLVPVIAVLVGLAGLLVPPASAGGTGTISGTVTTAGGSYPALSTRALMQVLNGSTWTSAGTAYTNHYGHYTSEPLAPGTYRVEFSNMDYRTQVSAPVTVIADAAVVVDATLDPGANIQGRFSIPVAGPAVDGNVHVFEQSSSGNWVEVDNGFVEPDGRYKVSGLAGGSYKVRFGDFKRYYATEYFDNVATLEQARVLSVPPGGSVTGIDVTMSTEALPVPPPPPPVVTHVAVSRGARVVGTVRVGKKVRATIGTVTPAGATVRYAWLLDGRRIKNATKRSLRLKPAMGYHQLSAKVIVTAPGLRRWVDISRSKKVRAAR